MPLQSNVPGAHATSAPASTGGIVATLHHGSSLTRSLLEMAIATITSGLIGYAIAKPFGFNDDARSIAVGLLMLTATLIVTYARTGFSTWSDEQSRRYMQNRTGIVETFKNLEACKAEMRADFTSAKEVSLLLQIGRREFGDSEASYFYPLLVDGKDGPSKVRILRASTNSPFLSEARATHRKANVARWGEDIRRLKTEIDFLKSTSKAQISDREHSEPYLWRLFIFDDVAYVSAYLFSNGNDGKAVVYRVRNGDNSLYTIFKKYF